VSIILLNSRNTQMRNLSQFPDQIFIVCDSNGGSWCFRLFYPLTPCSDQFCLPGTEAVIL
jgi:hypothetical protein